MLYMWNFSFWSLYDLLFPNLSSLSPMISSIKASSKNNRSPCLIRLSTLFKIINLTAKNQHKEAHTNNKLKQNRKAETLNLFFYYLSPLRRFKISFKILTEIRRNNFLYYQAVSYQQEGIINLQLIMTFSQVLHMKNKVLLFI